jgi:DNA invertase Pin-like site-specific DNA recombinase
MAKKIDLKAKRRYFAPTDSRKAVIYSRYSPRPNEDARTIESQEDYCTKYCEFQRWDIDSKFADHGITGTQVTGRVQLEEAIERCKKIRGVLVVYSLSRLARNTADALRIHQELNDAGCHIAMLDIQIDTTSGVGRAVFTIMAALAQLNAEQGAVTTSQAMKRYQKNGYAMSAKPPFGWKLGGGYQFQTRPDGTRKLLRTLEPDDHEQRCLDLIMECHARGWSLKKISEHLALCGYKSRTGKKFHSKSVWTIILREKDGMNPARVSANPLFIQKEVGLVPVDKPIITDNELRPLPGA